MYNDSFRVFYFMDGAIHFLSLKANHFIYFNNFD